MKIVSISLSNFLSFGEGPEQLAFTPFNSMVGPNDVGKTNVFRAFDLIYELLRNERFNTQPFYNFGDTSKVLEIRLGVKFTDEEVQALSDFLVCSSLVSGVSGQQNERQQMIDELRKKIVLTLAGKLFGRLFSETLLVVSGTWQETNPLTVEVFIRNNGREFSITRPGVLRKEPRAAGSYSQWNFPQAIIETLRTTNKSVIESLDTKSQAVEPPTVPINDIFVLIASVLDRNYPFPFSISFDGFHSGNIERQLGDRPEFRRLSNFLRTRGYRNSYCDLFSVIGTIYSSSIIRIESQRTPESTYLELDTAEAIGQPAYYLTGKSLSQALFYLKNSSRPNDVARFRRILTQFRDLTGGREFDVTLKAVRISAVSQTELVAVTPGSGASVQPTLPLPEGNVRLLGVRNKEAEEVRYQVVLQANTQNLGVPLELAAAGTFEALLLSTALFAKEDSVVLLDEPALNLHPMRQRHLLDTAQLSISENRNQVIAITHSPYLIDSLNINATWRISQQHGRTTFLSLAETFDKFKSKEAKKASLQLGNSRGPSALVCQGSSFRRRTIGQDCLREAGPLFRLEPRRERMGYC